MYSLLQHFTENSSILHSRSRDIPRDPSSVILNKAVRKVDIERYFYLRFLTILKENYPVQGRLLSWPRFHALEIGYVTKHGLNFFVIPHFNSTNYLALSRRFCSTIIRFQTFTVVWVERNVFFPTSAPRLSSLINQSSIRLELRVVVRKRVTVEFENDC